MTCIIILLYSHLYLYWKTCICINICIDTFLTVFWLKLLTYFKYFQCLLFLYLIFVLSFLCILWCSRIFISSFKNSYLYLHLCWCALNYTMITTFNFKYSYMHLYWNTFNYALIVTLNTLSTLTDTRTKTLLTVLKLKYTLIFILKRSQLHSHRDSPP